MNKHKPNYRSPYMYTLDKQEINWFDLDPELISVDRIASALSRITRYSGHWRIPLSVARHSIDLVGRLQPERLHPMILLQALFHDASEAFTCDIPSPMKRVMCIKHPRHGFIPYKRFEDELLRRIFTQLGIRYPIYPLVMEQDAHIYHDELLVIKKNPPRGFDYRKQVVKDKADFKRLAKRLFAAVH
jgi:hypothetical protein